MELELVGPQEVQAMQMCRTPSIFTGFDEVIDI